MIKIWQNPTEGYQEIKVNKFPNGEVYFDKELTDDLVESQVPRYHVFFKWESDEDLMHLYMFTKYLEQLDIKDNAQTLEIAYLPYSRMDRIEPGNNNMFSLKYITDFINHLDYPNVYIAEPHSNVSLDLIDNSDLVDVTLKLLDEYLEDMSEPVTIVLPDKGAYDRYREGLDNILTYSNVNAYSIVYGEKQRDFNTGEIKGIEIIQEVEQPIYMNCVILDDLTSYGGTFVGCKKELDSIGVDSVSLILTHAEKVFKEGELFKTGFKDIVVTNSMLPETLIFNLFYEGVAQNYGTNLKIKNIEEYI